MLTYVVRSKMSDWRMGSFKASADFFTEVSAIVQFNLWCDANEFNPEMCYFQLEN